MQKFVESIFTNPQGYHLGVAFALGKISFPAYRDLNYNQLLFGDPEMPIYTSPPRPIALSAPASLPIGYSSFVVNVTADNLPLPQAIVVITNRADSILAMAQTDLNGQTAFSLAPGTAEELSVTATKPNFLPVEKTIQAGGTPVADDGQFKGVLPALLGQNTPNPFNPQTVITYQLAKSEPARLEIYNLLGQKVRTLVDVAQKAGAHREAWDGKDEKGLAVASGTYFYRLSTPSFTAARKMTLLR
jgi:hypothetical protein